jgi:hypothetical protein
MHEPQVVESPPEGHRLRVMTGTDQTGFWAICECRWLDRAATEDEARARWEVHAGVVPTHRQ